jgi:histidine triad (HIT) family protein
MDCIFCKIVRGEAASYKVYEDEHVLAILDKYPISRGHTLVISKTHYTNVTDAPLELVTHAFRVAAAIAKVFRWRLGALGVNIISNAGRAAFQEVMHLHIHVIPRWRPGDPLFGGRHILTQDEAIQVISQLQPHMPTIRGLVEGSTDIP